MFIKNSLFTISPSTKEDIISLRNLYNNAEVMKYIPNSSQIWEVESVAEKISKFQKDSIGIHIVKTLNNNFLGEASIFNYPKLNCYEIGFIIDQKFWGKGFGTLICSELIDYCINHLHAAKVFARMYSNNVASQKVCIKSGMKLFNPSEEDLLYDRLTFSFSK